MISINIFKIHFQLSVCGSVFYTSPCVYLEIDVHNLFNYVLLQINIRTYLKAQAQYPTSAEMIPTLSPTALSMDGDYSDIIDCNDIHTLSSSVPSSLSLT